VAVLVGLMFGLLTCSTKAQDSTDSTDSTDFQNKAGLFSLMLYFFAFAGLSMLSAVAEDWRLFWREYHAGLYRAEVHVAVKLALDLLLVRVLPALVFGAVVYLMAGLRREAPAFLLFELTVALANLNAGLLCSAIGLALHRSPGAATLLAAVLMLLTVVWGSLQANVDCLHATVRWIPYCSWAYYAYELMLVEELRGELVQVAVPGSDTVVYLEAEALLDLLGLGKLSALVDILMLFGLALVWLLVNCLTVLLKLRPPRGGSGDKVVRRIEIAHRLAEVGTPKLIRTTSSASNALES